MQTCWKPGKFANWIAPPKVGIDNNPGDVEHVKIHLAHPMASDHGAAPCAKLRP
jgi:hypothetical protein